jgi:8-oxo-dGTP pyrophosphatase MutT (NUDIX family)
MLVTGLPDISAEFAKAIDTAALSVQICEVDPRLRLGAHIPFGVCRKEPFAARNPRTMPGDMDTRRDLPVVERTAARLVVLDTAGRVLLLHVQDLSQPELGTLWELPGGGMEAGETFNQAALRELREETGIEVGPEHIDEPRWRRQVEYVYRGECRHQRELIALVRISESLLRIDDSLRVGNEREDLLGARWWSMEQITASSELFYPLSLPTVLPRFLAGESIEEPLERWPLEG